MIFQRLRKWLGRLHKRSDIAVIADEGKPIEVVTTGKAMKDFERVPVTRMESDLDDLKVRYRITQRFEKPKKAVHADISKHMKHGKQLPHYRKSVKAKVKPEEEGDD